MMQRFGVLGLLVLLIGCGGTGDRRVFSIPTQISAKSSRTPQASSTTAPSTPPTERSGPTEVVPQPATATAHGHGDSPDAVTEADLAALLALGPGQFAGHTSMVEPSKIQRSYAQLDIPVADQGLIHLFRKVPDSLGSADISIYADPAKLHDAYTRLIQALETSEPSTSGYPVPDLGDQATQQIVAEGRNHSRAIVFVRCRALIDMSLLVAGAADTAMLMEYAKTIDQRIQDSPLCP